jgi:hypothetical protein
VIINWPTEQLQDSPLLPLPQHSEKKDEMGGACGSHGGGERCSNISVGRPEGRRLLGRPRRRWDDNIKMDLVEIGFGDVDWIHLAQDRDTWRALVNTVMNLRVP